ncbi:phospholipase A2 inhibitor 25 kDa subunit-like isoform X3 [Pimephales promelas]|uniref:phospholipase A2 inhibitor 25 kDa subunit-like isoform X3 n=1 Tax=Pimephales promelas TaxID=90988 RepID=UPI001955D40E|nr:phospholipase A2 inhibitor 25 kDa subunit-like isoform X3 [Pimephales promelas]
MNRSTDLREGSVLYWCIEMGLQASVLLLLTLLMAGFDTGRACGQAEHRHDSYQHSRLCYECAGVGNYCPSKLVMCPSGSSHCMSSTIVLDIGGTSLKIKKKECIDDCQNGSINLGLKKTSFSCCGTDFCNTEDAPDPRISAPNGRRCHYCDGQSCSNTVSCSGTEDSCITATVTNSGQSMLLKGCITKSVCGLLKCSFIQDLSCCEGNLCNTDKGLNLSVTHKGDTYRSLYEGAKKSDTYRSLYEGAKKSDTYRSLYKGAEKSDTQRSPSNGATSVTHSFLFSALLLPAALILQDSDY